MANTRIKADALPVPETAEQAHAILAEIGALDRALAKEAERLADAVAALKTLSEDFTAPVRKMIEAKFLALKSYVEANKSVVIPKGKKSVEWPTGTLGFRDTPVAVSVAKDAEAAILLALKAAELTDCIRTVESLDKEATRKNRTAVEKLTGSGLITGLKFSSRTEFFAKPLDTEVEHVKAVKAPKVSRAKAVGKAKPETRGKPT